MCATLISKQGLFASNFLKNILFDLTKGVFLLLLKSFSLADPLEGM